MIEKELEKLKKELYDVARDNYNKIRDYDEKTRMCRVNQKDNQIVNTLALSIIPYCITIFILMFIDGKIDLGIITNILPPFTMPLILIGSSLGIGSIFNKLINKKYKTKKRFRTFSKSKTEVEKIEEEITNQIELEKLKYRNKVINSVVENVEDNVSILSKISDRYTVVHKKSFQTKEETTNAISKITKLLEEKYKELDILVTKKVLHENFWRIRDKFQRICDPMLSTLGFSVGTLMLTTLPIIAADTLLASFPIFQKDLIFYSSLVCGGLVPNVYLIRSSKNRKRVFNNINQSLEDNSLPEKIQSVHEEEIELKLLLERTIREISLLEIQLIEQKEVEVLERVILEDTNDKDKSNTYCSMLSNIIYEEEQKEIDNGINTLNNIIEHKKSEPKKLVRKAKENKL